MPERVISATGPSAPPAPRRAFGLKDVFTAWNLLGGVMSLVFCVEGDLKWAGYALLLGYVGDVFDGLVARATRGANRFGAEFDNIVDHLTQCIAPALIVYIGFRDLNRLLAIGLAALLMLTGSIRHARSAVTKCSFSLCWVGLPRTVSMLVIISYLNSSVWRVGLGGLWGGAVLVAGLSVLNLIPLPFLSHHGRKLQFYVKVLIALTLGLPAVAAIVPMFRPFVFDVVFFWLFGYMFVSWIPMRPAERREFFLVTRQWLRDIAAAR